MSSLLRSETPENAELADLRSRAVELEASLARRSAAVARLQADLDAFGVSYREKVGILHQQLDELEQSITEAELGHLGESGQPSKDKSGGSGGSDRSAKAMPARTTSDVVRSLFRELAKAIHPDLAHDTHTRGRRHALMVEANRAYALGDEQQLRSILNAWERSPEAVPDNDPEAARLRLVRRITQAEEELVRLADDEKALKTSPLGKLKTMVDEAAAKRRDLVAEMVARLKRDITAATNRLDAIRPSG